MPNDFFVHVIESPSSVDLLNANLEGRVLFQARSVCQIDASYHVAADNATFWTALGDRLLDKIEQDKAQRWPVIHLSAHGSPDGIELTDHHFIRWTDLTSYLQRINTILQGKLILAVSSCHGCYAIKEALHGTHPYYALVGPTKAVGLSDLAVGFSAFYHVLSKSWDLSKAHAAMRAAADSDAFALLFTEQFRQGYQSWVMQQDIQRILAGFYAQGLPQAPVTPSEQK